MQQKPSLLFITRKFPPSVGGMERYAADLFTALHKETKVHLVKWGGPNKYLPLVLPVLFVRACWLLITKDIDIIHVQDGLLSPMGVVLKFLFRKPVTVVAHGLDVTFDNRPYQKIIPRALQRMDHIFCISSAAEAEVLKRGVPSQRVSIIPLGITDDLFINNKAVARARILKRLPSADPAAKLLLSTGRLVKRKGVNWFIEQVMPKLVAQDPSILFLVSGDGEDKERIAATIKRKKLDSSVQLLGRTSDSFIKDLYNGSDIFVMPNITVPGDMEGFGRVLLEAALCQQPVVATGIEGIRDAIIDGKNGVLVAEQDVAAFVRNILNFTADNQRQLAFGKAARQYTLKTFNWPTIASRHLAVYRQLVADSASRRP